MNENREQETAAVGYVVGEVSTEGFSFVTNPQLAPPRLEYVRLRGLRERQGDRLREVDVLAQVSQLSVSSRLLSGSMNYGEVETILRRLGASPPVLIGQANILGYLDPETRSVRVPRGAAMPGAVVEKAPDAMLRNFFSKGVADGLEIGALINRPQVDVKLDPNGLRRHMAVIAQTGAGKSYTVGVVLEQLLQLGGSIMVFDPNSDYVKMGRQPDGRATPFAERVQVFRAPGEQSHRIPDEMIDNLESLSLRFAGLDVDEICDLAGISDKATNIRYGVRSACRNLEGSDYTPEQLLDELRAIASFAQIPEDMRGEEMPPPPIIPDIDPKPASPDVIDSLRGDKSDLETLFGPAGDGGEGASSSGATPEDLLSRALISRQGGSGGASRPVPTEDAISGANKALKYIEFLAALRIWGFQDLPMESLVSPMRLSVFDLAGIDRRIADFLVAKAVGELWRMATREGLPRPVFIVLEEAHNFVPGGRGVGGGHAARWLKRIASEGRKFGLFLVLVTQRPNKIHQDTLSQCGSQIIMRLTNPEDQSAIRRASESISESLLGDLPGLNVGEAVVLGPSVRVPVMVRVRSRLSDEGGSDIDLRAALERSREEAVGDRYRQRSAERRAKRERSAWEEEI